MHVVSFGCSSVGFHVAVVLVIDEQVFRVIYHSTILQWPDIMHDGLRSSINRLIHIHLPRIRLRLRQIPGQVFEDERILEDSCGVLGPAVHILLFLFIHLGLQILDL